MVGGELMMAHVEHERRSWDGVEMKLEKYWGKNGDEIEMKFGLP